VIQQSPRRLRTSPPSLKKNLFFSLNQSLIMLVNLALFFAVVLDVVVFVKAAKFTNPVYVISNAETPSLNLPGLTPIGLQRVQECLPPVSFWLLVDLRGSLPQWRSLFIAVRPFGHWSCGDLSVRSRIWLMLWDYCNCYSHRYIPRTKRNHIMVW